MDYENISDDLINELLNAETPSLNENESHYLQLTSELNMMNAQLTKIIEILCRLCSLIGNIQTKLNSMDDCIVLH